MRLVVVGGGVTGLAAAWEASADPAVQVTVLESDERLGGKVRTSAIELDDGTELVIDEAADAFLARVPDAVALCGELGLTDELTQPAIGRAKVFVDGELRFLPERTVLGVPLDMDALAAAGLLSEAGVAAAADELDRDDPADDHDVAIGPFLAERYGPELVDRIVGPLIGGINAGDIDELSLRAVTPQLADAAAEGASLSRALQRRQPAVADDRPVFHGLLGGTGRLVDALSEALEDRGVTLRTGTPVAALDRADSSWTVRLEDGSTLAADAVLLATPAPAAGRLVAPHCQDAAAELGSIHHSSVTLVTLVYDAADVTVPLDASGFLVPRSAGLVLTAASFGSSKWAHWDDGRHVVLRVSAGRTGDERQAEMDDDELVAALRADLATTMGLDATPVGVRVSRWPLGFAQYTVGHLERVERIEQALERDCPTLAVTGAAYRGLGLPACIRQGRESAAQLVASGSAGSRTAPSTR
jgi:oxygen-dependent protoporphyrinogen oxidase